MDQEPPLLYSPYKELLIRVARTQEDLEKSYRLRYEVYCLKMKTENPSDFPDQKEKDWFDQYATSLLLFHREKTIGMVRFVTDTPRGFYSERNFPFPENTDRTKTVELSRLIAEPNRDLIRTLAKEKIHLGVLILEASVIWSLKNNFTHWYGACNLPFYLHLTKELGWTIQDLTPEPQIYHGTKVMPFLLDLQNGRHTPFPYPVDENGKVSFPSL